MNVEDKRSYHAWAAGLIDGEGSVGFYSRKTRYGAKYYLMLRVKMTNKDVLDQLVKIFAVGTVNGPYIKKNKDGYKRRDEWSWDCTNSKEILHVLSLIRPFSILKLPEINVAMEWLQSPEWQRRNKETYSKMFQLKRNLKTINIQKEIYPLFEIET